MEKSEILEGLKKSIFELDKELMNSIGFRQNLAILERSWQDSVSNLEKGKNVVIYLSDDGLSRLVLDLLRHLIVLVPPTPKEVLVQWGKIKTKYEQKIGALLQILTKSK